MGDKKQLAVKEIQRLKYIRAQIQKTLSFEVTDMDVDEGQSAEV